MDETIFIQIASYRDPQLVPTILDCIANAQKPERLHFCIGWQHGENENIDGILHFPNITIIAVPYKDSMGACWMRNHIQRYYNGETYTFQLDSHHRFIKNWDTTLVDMLKELQTKGVKKPLITGYIPSFDPDNDPAARIMLPWKMNFDRFIPEGAIFFTPGTIENLSEVTGPVPSRFYSAHFCFTLGQFCLEVPHDPEYYFHGEEISIAVRAYTHGYGLFHPHKVIAWHEYTRRGRTKHWDHLPHMYGTLNGRCHLRNRKLFGMDNEPQDVDFGIYGFGKERTLHDYEVYAGISFKDRAVQQYTLDHKIPPNPPVENWEKSLCRVFKHCIDITYDRVPEKDYDFWCVAFKDKDGKDLFRKDAVKEEIDSMFKDPDKYCKIWREFTTETKPCSWIVWPHSISKAWCDPITGAL